MEDLGDIKKTDNISVFVTYGLGEGLRVSHCGCVASNITYQMAEMTRNHELEGLRGAGSVPCHHRVASHDLADGGGVGVKSFRGDL